MPNDVQDWTTLNQVNLVGGISKVAQGDVAGASLQTDQGSDTITASGGPSLIASSALASMKAAAGSTIARVGAAGSLATGNNTSVSPAFGQAPTAGDLLVAWITSGGTAITTAQAGWVQAVLGTAFSIGAAVWVKPNAAGGDAAPTFTDASSGAPMMAQLAEFSGVATASPTDQTGTGSSGSSATVTVAAGAADVAFGDLVLMATRWVLSQAGTATFSDALNNGAAAVNAGNSGAVNQVRHSSFVYGIIPAATVAQPLGVADWAYDAVGTSGPAAGSQASVVLAATPGKTYTAASVAAALASSAGAGGAATLQLLDGASVKLTHTVGVTAATGASQTVGPATVAIKGTSGNSMTLQWAGTLAGVFESCTLGAYLR